MERVLYQSCRLAQIRKRGTGHTSLLFTCLCLPSYVVITAVVEVSLFSYLSSPDKLEDS